MNNMKFFTVIFVICASLAVISGQHFFGRIPSRQIVSNSLDYGLSSSSPVMRDPRQNRGPVLFPPPPSDAVDESSGVVVGASGYGFVPPQQSTTLHITPPRYLGALSAAQLTDFNYYSILPYLPRWNFI